MPSGRTARNGSRTWKRRDRRAASGGSGVNLDLTKADSAVAEFLDPAPLADLLAGYCLEIEPRQKIVVRSTTLARPLLLELQRAILEREAWPTFEIELPGEATCFYRH